MQPRGSAAKYLTVHRAPTDDELERHIAGEITLAAVLVAQNGTARTWAVDVDEGGPAAVRARVEALDAAGLPCVGIAVRGRGDHDGGHVWGCYGEPVDPKAAQAQIRAILQATNLPTDELWPCGKNIRLPLGVHTHHGRRGTLIRAGQPGVNLDTPEGLAEGIKALLALAPSPTPPELVPTPPRAPQRAQQPQKRAQQSRTGGTDVREVIARYNRAHSLKQRLERDGATLADAANNLYHCPCGAHASGTASLQIIPSSNPARYGEFVAWSYSPNCRIAPHQSEKKPLDAFGYYAQVEHGGDTTAALRAYNPIAPRQQHETAEYERNTPDPATRAARAKDAQRKRDARREEAAATLADVRDRACEDALLARRPAELAVLKALLEVAGNRAWCRPSKARLVDMTGYSLGAVKRALRALQARGYFVSQGDGGGPNDTALRTFLRGSCPRMEGGHSYVDHGDGGMIHEYIEHKYLEHDLERVRGGAALPSQPEPHDVGEPDDLDSWAWQADDGHGAAELDELAQAVDAPPPSPAPRPAPVAQLSHNSETFDLRAWLRRCKDSPVPPLCPREDAHPEVAAPRPRSAETSEPDSVSEPDDHDSTTPVAPARVPEVVHFEGGVSFDPYAPPPPPRDLRPIENWRLLEELCAHNAVPAQPAEPLPDDTEITLLSAALVPARLDASEAWRRYWSLKRAGASPDALRNAAIAARAARSQETRQREQIRAARVAADAPLVRASPALSYAQGNLLALCAD